jgi:hypothetical protein
VAKASDRLKAADWRRCLPGFNRNAGVREWSICFLIDDSARKSTSNWRTYKHWMARNAFDRCVIAHVDRALMFIQDRQLRCGHARIAGSHAVTGPVCGACLRFTCV